ncbi:TPA: hypothetical protein ACPSKL_000173 [Legionella anisa]
MGVKISALPPIVTPDLTDVFAVVQGGVTYKETVSQLLTLIQANNVASVEGTENQVLVSGGFGTQEVGDIVLSLPQDIAPTDNITSNNFIEGYTTTATAGGTTTLTVDSTGQQFFTGTMNQTVQMPVTSTLVLGQEWKIVNRSSGTLTVTSSGGNTITTVLAFSSAIITCILTSGTTDASWTFEGQPSIGQFFSIVPTFSFTTPGDLSVVYTTQNGRYQRLGNIVFWSFDLSFTPTFTTSTGSAFVTITGAPVASASAPQALGSAAFNGGVVFAANSYVNSSLTPTTNQVAFLRTTASGSFSNLNQLAFPSGSPYRIIASGYYFI